MSYTAVLAICVDQEWTVMLGKGIEVPGSQIFEIIVAAGQVASQAGGREADLPSQAKMGIVHLRSVLEVIASALYHLHDQALSNSQVAEGQYVDPIEEEADLVGIKAMVLIHIFALKYNPGSCLA